MYINHLQLLTGIQMYTFFLLTCLFWSYWWSQEGIDLLINDKFWCKMHCFHGHWQAQQNNSVSVQSTLTGYYSMNYGRCLENQLTWILIIQNCVWEIENLENWGPWNQGETVVWFKWNGWRMEEKTWLTVGDMKVKCVGDHLKGAGREELGVGTVSLNLANTFSAQKDQLIYEEES